MITAVLFDFYDTLVDIKTEDWGDDAMRGARRSECGDGGRRVVERRAVAPADEVAPLPGFDGHRSWRTPAECGGTTRCAEPETPDVHAARYFAAGVSLSSDDPANSRLPSVSVTVPLDRLTSPVPVPLLIVTFGHASVGLKA